MHQRWVSRSGVSAEELAAIGLDGLATLDDRSRVAVLFAIARSKSRFRDPVPAAVASQAADHLTPAKLAAVEAVARAMALANLSVNTIAAFRARVQG